MLRHMFKAKIHRARITEACLDYAGSLTVDRELLDAAGILPHEMVQVYNINTGERFETYAIAGPAGSGVICLNGAAARKGQARRPGHHRHHCWLAESELPGFVPTVVRVDQANHPLPA